MKTAIITGVTGQVGSYLSELLLSQGYNVVGLARRVSVDTTDRIKHLIPHNNFELVIGDITDYPLISRLVMKYEPNEYYNLAAQSHVGVSFSNASTTMDIDVGGCLNALEAIRVHCPECRFLQASTSEMFGSNYTEKVTELDEKDNDIVLPAVERFQNEDTPFAPNSPYAVAKLAAHHLVRVYRDSYDLHANAIIMFNNESPRRGNNFVTRKISRYVAAVHNYLSVPHPMHTELDIFKEKMEVSKVNFEGIPKLRLGNIYAMRDWGHSKCYTRAMNMMLQMNYPDDYVVASGKSYSVEHFLKTTFNYVGIQNYMDYVEIDENLLRPSEVEYLNGDSSKAREVLGWSPEVSFEDLVKEMIEYDISQIKKESQALQVEFGEFQERERGFSV